jgi:hypothetical protein
MVVQRSPGATGCASLKTPVVTISPGARGGASGWRAGAVGLEGEPAEDLQVITDTFDYEL